MTITMLLKILYWLLMVMNRQIFTIEQVNNYVKSLMDNDPLLQDLWIRGKYLILNDILQDICIYSKR